MRLVIMHTRCAEKYGSNNQGQQHGHTLVITHGNFAHPTSASVYVYLFLNRAHIGQGHTLEQKISTIFLIQTS